MDKLRIVVEVNAPAISESTAKNLISSIRSDVSRSVDGLISAEENDTRTTQYSVDGALIVRIPL